MKSFATPAGIVQAVRGVDVVDRRRRDRRAARPERRRQVDDDRHAARADAARRRQRARCSACRPTTAIGAGASARCCRPAACCATSRCASSSTMMASLYPTRSPSTRCSSSSGIARRSPGGARRSCPAARRSACGSRSRSSATPTCSCSTSRRWRWTSRAAHAFWATMRGFAAGGKTVLFATHYLEEADAYADRAVLMARGRVVADGPTTEIKAMVGLRTIRATLPGRRPRRARSAAGRDARRAARRGGGARVLRLRRGDPRAARRGSRGARHRDQRRRPRGGVPRADGATTRTDAREHRDLHALRGPARVPQPPLLHLLARLPAGALLRDRRARTGTSPTSAAPASTRRCTSWSASRRSAR